MAGERWARLVLGFSLATILGIGLQFALATLDPHACRYRTALLLLPALLTGPGGIALVGIGMSRRSLLTPLGMGVVLASLYPVLYDALRAIGQLRPLCGL
jgi:hypothetical protein